MNFIDELFSDSFSDMHRGLNKLGRRAMFALSATDMTRGDDELAVLVPVKRQSIQPN